MELDGRGMSCASVHLAQVRIVAEVRGALLQYPDVGRHIAYTRWHRCDHGWTTCACF